MSTPESPIEWVPNPRAHAITSSDAVAAAFPEGVFTEVRNFHRQIPGYRPSPLRSLGNLASMLGVGGIWVKDESQRLDLNSFKVLGGSFAIYKFIKHKLGLDDRDLSFDELVSESTRSQLEGLTFATATDGNHGRGVRIQTIPTRRPEVGAVSEIVERPSRAAVASREDRETACSKISI